jgi:hypothetical protein
MSKIAIAIFLLALVVIIYLSVFAPISDKTKGTGQNVLTNQKSVDSQLGNLATPIN